MSAVAAVAFVLGSLTMGVAATADVGSDDAVPLEERHLPTAVNAPGTWSSDEDVRGPVAAVGIATRTESIGIFGEKQSLALFAVSAIDGSASWVRTPGFSLERWGFVGGLAVSPDGQWLAWVRPRPSGRSPVGRISGWSVMNTTTGAVRQLEVPGFPWVRGTMADLAFSGDSRHLLTSYEAPEEPKDSRFAHQFVAWDVEDGHPTVIEEPGHRWLPNLGSAPSGVTWARGRQVFRVNPGDDDRTTVTLPQHVTTASWGPDDASFAYIGRPSLNSAARWRLYAGRTVAESLSHPVDLPPEVNPDQLLGWRDATHVVVGHFRSSVHVVDVVTGEVEAIDLAGYGDQVNAPQLAGALWAQPLITPVAPDGTTDPRRPWRWVSGAVLLLLGGLFLVLWRRSSVRREPRSGHAYDAAAPPRPLRPLATVATGLVIVLIDFRVEGLDLIPDPVGWGIAAWALSSLQTVHRGFYVASVAAWLAVVPSLPEWLGKEGLVITISIALAVLVVQFAACTAIMVERPRREPSASAIRSLALGLSAALVLALAAAAVEPSVAIVAIAVGLAELMVMMWFLVLLYGVAKDVPADVA